MHGGHPGRPAGRFTPLELLAPTSSPVPAARGADGNDPWQASDRRDETRSRSVVDIHMGLARVSTFMADKDGSSRRNTRIVLGAMKPSPAIRKDGRPQAAEPARTVAQTCADAPGPEQEAESVNRGSLERGLAILRVLSEAQQPLSLSAIAEATGTDPSTVHRVLKVLVKQDYAIRDPSAKRYLPGAALLYPISLFHPLQELRRDAQPIMQDLASRTGFTVALVVFLGQKRIVLDIRHGRERLAPFYDANHSRPLHASAVGKMLLTTLSDPACQALLGPEPYQRYTPDTITRWRALRDNLDAARERGYTSALDEAFVGLKAFAAPLVFGDRRRVLGCLAVFGSSRTPPVIDFEQVPGEVVNAAALLGLMSAALRAVDHLGGASA
jgi:IclR family acetate operon transcriptional repressor